MRDVGSENNLRISTNLGPESGNCPSTELAPFFLRHKTPILVRKQASICLRLPSSENGGLRSGSGERALLAEMEMGRLGEGVKKRLAIPKPSVGRSLWSEVRRRPPNPPPFRPRERVSRNVRWG
jgi:hypothetical protein